MKKVVFTYLSFFLLLFNLQLFSQNHVMSKTPTIRKAIQVTISLTLPPQWHYDWTQNETIDYESLENEAGGDLWWRITNTGFQFDLSDIPSYASNITANLEAYRYNGAGASKIVLMSDDTDFSNLEGSGNSVYNEVTSGSVLFITPTSQGVLHNVTSHVLSRISQGYINFGVKAGESMVLGKIIIKLHIDYEVPLTAKNNFSGGSININVDNPAISKTTPSSFNVIPTISSITLAAVEQTIDDYDRIWHTGSIERSNWDRNNELRSYYQTFPFTASESDGDKTYTANLRKMCKIDFINYHSGGEVGGSIIVKGVTKTSPSLDNEVVEKNPITGQAVNHSINGIDFSFISWSDGGGTSYSHTFTPSTHKDYEANFSGRPNNYYRNQYFNTKVVGQPIIVYWSQHPNTNVTKYGVYRKTKFGTEQLVKTQNRTSASSYSFTDTEYSHTSNTSTTNLLWYDVRAYYGPDGNYSDYDWRTLYGELLPKESEDVLDEKIVLEKYEYGISNYPNPYNPTTTISYSIKEQGTVQITVYDALGRKIADLVNEVKRPGSYNAMFNGSNLTSGIYFYTMKVNEFMETKKMLLTK